MEEMHFSKLEENLGYGVCLQDAEQMRYNDFIVYAIESYLITWHDLKQRCCF